jgi:hypothetical protein
MAPSFFLVALVLLLAHTRASVEGAGCGIEADIAPASDRYASQR